MLRRLCREPGQDLVEYALVLPVLALLLFGIVEFALVIFAYDTIGNAAREGARYGAINPTNSAGINTAARRLTTALDPADLTVTSSLPGGGVIRVVVTYKAKFVTGLIPPALGGQTFLPLTAVATMQIE